MAIQSPQRGIYGWEAHANSVHGFGTVVLHVAQVTTATAWPTANLAVYVPIRVLSRKVVKKLWIAAGSTGTGNVDIGVYDAAGTRLVSSGSTAKVASNSEQVLDVTDTPLGPGLFYMALVSSNNTDTFVRDNNWAAPGLAANGVLSESVFPLPATATWAVDQTLTYLPEFGMLFGTTVT